MSGDEGDAASGCAMFWKSVSVFCSESSMAGAPSAFVDKNSIMKHSALRSLIQSMQQNNVVEVVCDTISPGCYSHLFLEIPHFTMESEGGKHSAISPSRRLGHFHRSCGYLFPHTHPQRLPYTNSGHCRLAFLQLLGYSPRL